MKIILMKQEQNRKRKDDPRIRKSGAGGGDYSKWYGRSNRWGQLYERGFEDERFRDPNTQIVKRLDLPDVTEQKGKAEDPFGDQTDTQNNTEEHKNRIYPFQ